MVKSQSRPFRDIAQATSVPFGCRDSPGCQSCLLILSLNNKILHALVDADGKNPRSSSEFNTNEKALCGSEANTGELPATSALTNTSPFFLGQLAQGAHSEIALISFLSLLGHLLQIFKEAPAATQSVERVWYRVYECLDKFHSMFFHLTFM